MKVRRDEQLKNSFDAVAIRNEVEAMIGKPVKLLVVVNHGKTKIEEGVITSVYSNLFLLETIKSGVIAKTSHTLIDIFTGRVIIQQANE